jgi:hypothetical protein
MKRVREEELSSGGFCLLDALLPELYSKLMNESGLATFDKLMLALSSPRFYEKTPIYPLLQPKPPTMPKARRKFQKQIKQRVKQHVWILAAKAGSLIIPQSPLFDFLNSVWPFAAIDKLEGIPHHYVHLKIVKSIAQYAHWSYLQSQIQEGFPLVAPVLTAAVKSNCLAKVGWIRKCNDLRPMFSDLLAAIEKQNIPMLCFLFEWWQSVSEDPIPNAIFHCAAMTGNQFLLEGLFYFGIGDQYDGLYETMRAIAQSGNVETLQWYYTTHFRPRMQIIDLEEECEFGIDVLKGAILSGSIAMLNWVYDQRPIFPLSSPCLNEFVIQNQLNPDILLWLKSHRCI